MVFWTIAIAVTTLACAALYNAAAGRRAVALPGADDATSAHYRLQLREIDADIAAGRLGEAEAVAARGEVARELIRLKGEARPDAGARRQGAVVLVAIAATALLSFGLYATLGRPDLPAQPLAERPEQQMTLDDAVARIEAQLTRTPDDLRGWVAIAPAYMQLRRFPEAERAYRRVIELGGASADAETSLAEAIMMGQGGSLEGEPRRLLEAVAAREPAHVPSRFYLAGEATRTGDYAAAVAQWTEVIGLAGGDEPWLETARAGLAAAEAGLRGAADMPGPAEIEAMVEGLSERLAASGGSIEEWTQLVRARLVLGQTDAARAAYEAARAAYRDAAVRAELDLLALENGLVAN